MKKVTHLSCFLLLFLLFSGCSEPLPKGMPPLYPVTLVFLQEGKPLEGASISLIPVVESEWGVGGSTDASGSIQLQTHGKYPGVPAGKYKITVSKYVSEGELPKIGEVLPPMKHYNFVDEKFSNVRQTTLEIEVLKGKNKFEPFDLGKAIRSELVPPH